MKSFSDFSSNAKYKFVRAIGRGGCADVLLYRRHSAGLPAQDVVLKLLRSETRESSVEMINEGRRLSKLKHPNIVATFGYEFLESQRFGLLMEYIPGSNLKEIIPKIAGPYREKIAGYVLRVIAEALAAAHEQDVVHGDMSSRNILVSERGLLKLTDFGAGPEKGSLDYLAPERMIGTSRRRESDVFALGLVALELLLGRNEFEFASLGEARKKCKGVLKKKPWAQWAKWSDFFEKSLNEDPGARPTARELSLAIPIEVSETYEVQNFLSKLIQEEKSDHHAGTTVNLRKTVTMVLRRGWRRPQKVAGYVVAVLVMPALFTLLLMPQATGVDHALKGRMHACTLTVTSKPWGEVFIDGKSAGYTPLVNLRLSTGNHEFIWRGQTGAIVRRSLSAFENGLLALQILQEKGRPLKVAPIKPVSLDL